MEKVEKGPIAEYEDRCSDEFNAALRRMRRARERRIAMVGR